MWYFFVDSYVGLFIVTARVTAWDDNQPFMYLLESSDIVILQFGSPKDFLPELFLNGLEYLLFPWRIFLAKLMTDRREMWIHVSDVQLRNADTCM